MTYLPIEDYGLIGNMCSAALIGRNGSLDWLCLPRFDSPSLFAALLDEGKGGHFQIAPADAEQSTHRQLYWPDSNILVTRFLSGGGVAELTDYMPVAEGDVIPEGAPVLVRRVQVIRGEMDLRATCQPAFDYARVGTRARLDGNTAVFEGAGRRLHLTVGGITCNNGFAQLQEQDSPCSTLSFSLEEGETVIFSLFYEKKEYEETEGRSQAVRALDHEEERALFKQTLTYWRDWIRTLARTGAPLGPRAQAHDLRAHRRHRGCAHLLPP